MHAEGSNGSITLDGDRVRIRHKGLANMMTAGLHGELEIPLSNITAIQMKPAGALLAGYIQLSILGGQTAPGGLMEATKDKNAVLFVKKQQAAFEEMKSEIERRIAVRQTPRTAPTEPSAAMELEKLAGLVERGFLTREEFDQRKKALLGL